MNPSIKTWVRLETIEICKGVYGLISDLEGNLRTPEGKIVKWEIRDSKPQSPWEFSVTIAMGLAGFAKQPPEEIALFIAKQLRDLSKSTWVFEALGPYINAYFLPATVKDYFEDKVFPDWEQLKKLDQGVYGHYRLEMIYKALEARGLQMEEPSPASLDLKSHPLHQLFNFPDQDPVVSEDGTGAWETWLGRVCKMTALGDLRGLTPEMERELFAFIKACLKR